jgi:enoyl-CoA hydratase
MKKDPSAGSGFLYTVTRNTAWINLSDAYDGSAPLEFYRNIASVLSQADADKNVHAVVLTGGRELFCADDSEALSAFVGVDSIRACVRARLEMFRAIEISYKPVLAAVEGAAIGLGCEITMACDIVVASARASFALPQTRMGLIPSFAVVRGRDIAGMHAIKYMVYTGEAIVANDALVLGLANRLVTSSTLLEETQRIADKLASNAPLGVKVGKAMVNRNVEEGYMFAVEAATLVQASEDYREGIAALRQQRPAQFVGR